MTSDHRFLFDVFGVEQEFSTSEAVDLLSKDPSNQRDLDWFARNVRTDARKHAIDELEGHYLCCLDNDRERLIFTRRPEYLDQQFKRQRRDIIGTRGTSTVLLEIMAEVVAYDPDVDIPEWLHVYRWEQRTEAKMLALEEEKREWAAMKAAA